MKKKILITIGIMILIVVLIGMALYILDHDRMAKNKPVIFSTWGKSYEVPLSKGGDSIHKETQDINLALTMNDKITDNTIWCGTFQLIWNDLKNELAKQDIIFTPQLEIVENLNKGDFNIDKISEDYYYKVYGHPSNELKKEIEQAIKDKFNETSDILNNFDWGNVNTNDYFLYAMLRKDFIFEKAFEEWERGTFANKYDNIQYFGVKKNSSPQMKSQVTVLYYHSNDDFAIKLTAKPDDEVILCKTKEGNTFNEIYSKIVKEEKTSKSNKKLTEQDELKIPNIKLKEKRELTALENKPFSFSNGQEYYIETALQTIEFELNKEGGKIKSEAGMMVNESAMITNPEIREFYLDDTFTIFLKEKTKDMPYFAAKIADITKFQ